MDARTENRERLKKLGIVPNEHGDFELTPEAQAKLSSEQVLSEAEPPAAAPAAPTTPAAPAAPLASESAPPQPPPSAPLPDPAAAPAAPSMQDQRDARRHEAVKEEQRRLSQLQTQLRGEIAQVQTLRKELETRMAGLPLPGAPTLPAASSAPGQPSPTQERLEALRQASPDLYEAMVALVQEQAGQLVNQAVAPVHNLKQAFDQMQASAAENDYDARYDKVLTVVRAKHPNVEAKTSDPKFQTWLQAKPPIIRDAAIRDIYQDSANADPSSILYVLDLYDKETAPPTPPMPPQPRVAPSVGPSGSGAGVRSDPAAPTPLSEQEILDFPRMKAAVAHDPVALTHLMRRVALTVPS